VIVTGATGGIGRAIVDALAAGAVLRVDGGFGLSVAALTRR
jgi:NAD(P)-dependent dehydrogenase (short-subunit alcohol dehydrogenase family)